MNNSRYLARLSPRPIFERDKRQGETQSEFYLRVSKKVISILKGKFPESSCEQVVGFGWASITLPWSTVVDFNTVRIDLGVMMELDYKKLFSETTMA